jgi:hypothetical protein
VQSCARFAGLTRTLAGKRQRGNDHQGAQRMCAATRGGLMPDFGCNAKSAKVDKPNVCAIGVAVTAQDAHTFRIRTRAGRDSAGIVP